MVLFSVYIYGVAFINKFWWESGFLRRGNTRFMGNTRYK